MHACMHCNKQRPAAQRRRRGALNTSRCWRSLLAAKPGAPTPGLLPHAHHTPHTNTTHHTPHTTHHTHEETRRVYTGGKRRSQLCPSHICMNCLQITWTHRAHRETSQSIASGQREEITRDCGDARRKREEKRGHAYYKAVHVPVLQERVATVMDFCSPKYRLTSRGTATTATSMSTGGIAR